MNRMSEQVRNRDQLDQESWFVQSRQQNLTTDCTKTRTSGFAVQNRRVEARLEGHDFREILERHRLAT